MEIKSYSVHGTEIFMHLIKKMDGYSGNGTMVHPLLIIPPQPVYLQSTIVRFILLRLTDFFQPLISIPAVLSGGQMKQQSGKALEFQRTGQWCMERRCRI